MSGSPSGDRRRTPEETLDALFELLWSEPETEAEVDEQLREMGYDPDEIGKRMAAVAAAALAKRAKGEQG